MAVRLPKAMLEAAKLAAGDLVELEAQGLSSIVVRAKRKRSDIEELVSRITPKNLHEATDWGEPRGKEVW